MQTRRGFLGLIGLGAVANGAEPPEENLTARQINAREGIVLCAQCDARLAISQLRNGSIHVFGNVYPAPANGRRDAQSFYEEFWRRYRVRRDSLEEGLRNFMIPALCSAKCLAAYTRAHWGSTMFFGVCPAETVQELYDRKRREERRGA